MKIHHDQAGRRFTAAFPDAGEAVLTYQLHGDRVIFTHTFVPPALRGRGLAETLTRAGLAWADGQRLRVEATCSYVAAFLTRERTAEKPKGG